jgi:hypothetical protein
MPGTWPTVIARQVDFFDALTLRKMFDGCGNGCKTGAAAGKIREGEIK